MSTFTQHIVDKIRMENIKPLSAWRFWFWRGISWTGVFVFALLSGIATAFALHVIGEIDWGVYAQGKLSWYGAIFVGVPFLWIGFLIAFLIIAVIFLRSTRRGYRYSHMWLLGMFFLVSGITGYTMEAASFDAPVEKFLIRSIPHFEVLERQLVPSAEKQWSRPEKGLLGGHVLQVSDQKLQIEDLNKNEWTIDTSDAKEQTGAVFKKNDQIKVIGEEESRNTFKAQEVRSWKESQGNSSTDDQGKTGSQEESVSGQSSNDNGQGLQDKQEQGQAGVTVDTEKKRGENTSNTTGQSSSQQGD